jgi:hypothetical protein
MGECDLFCPLYSGRVPDISQLFKDAVKLSAATWIKYVWIDSLCIVQNDYEDWKREAFKMAEY